MALVSPGVQISVTDQSQYSPNNLGTTAYILLATAQDKVAPGGTTTATGTMVENADNVYNITSQRDLVTTFGTPTFKTSASGSALNADEQNEYGLMAAYSLLGVSNNVYIQRANVDLSTLGGSVNRPLSDPSDGTYWLDVANTNWGMYTWDSSANTFSLVSPTVITSNSSTYLTGTAPNVGFGAIGSYAVNATQGTNPIYQKMYDNTWQLVGSEGWKIRTPVVTGGTGTITANGALILNTHTVTVYAGNTVSQISSLINAGNYAGISSWINSSGQLTISANTLGASVNITNGTNTPLADLGITPGNYAIAAVSLTPYYTVPNWQGNIRANTVPPTGSIWQKASVTGSGLTTVVNQYSAASGTWMSEAVQDFANVFQATYTLDPTGGGLNIPVGTTYARYDAYSNVTLCQSLFNRLSSGPTVVTGTTTSPAGVGTGASCTIRVRPNLASVANVLYTITVTTTGGPAGLVNAISAANIPYVTANISSTGAFTITHSTGGDMLMIDGAQTPLANVGINAYSNNVYPSIANAAILVGSSWHNIFPTSQPSLDSTLPSYISSTSQPYVDPADSTYWYYNTPSRVDIMVSNGSAWCGYKNLGTTDIRGYDLSLTDPNGPIISATTPTLQSDGSVLVAGDLWIDTGDLDNYPVIYRYQYINGIAQWVLITNTDSVGQNGIIFADARWDTSGTTDPATASLIPVSTLQLSNYVDLDAPNPGFYPRGMLLWNTRASGFNVKQYKANYFTATAFPNASLPSRKDTWLSVTGFDQSNIPNFGRKAQRGVVIAALKSAIDSSTTLREDSTQFNLIACPGYPELISNMVSLNNDRNNTAFVVGDTPMRLPATGTDIQNWATNAGKSSFTGEDGLNTISPYSAVYYPSGQTSDLSGNAIVVPPSHATLRAIVKSDTVSYPWFAPAGASRGIVDNVSAIGYVDANSGNFVVSNITQGLRDVMYTYKINPLTNLPGSGLLVYGQKTLASTPSSLDRINVARLVNYLRTQLNKISQPFIFEPNDPITRNAIKSVCTNLLNNLIAQRGITDYLVVCDTTNNTPDVIAANELYIDIAIEPQKAVEFIYIPIRLAAPGSLASGQAVTSTAGTGA